MAAPLVLIGAIIWFFLKSVFMTICYIAEYFSQKKTAKRIPSINIKREMGACVDARKDGRASSFNVTLSPKEYELFMKAMRSGGRDQFEADGTFCLFDPPHTFRFLGGRKIDMPNWDGGSPPITHMQTKTAKRKSPYIPMRAMRFCYAPYTKTSWRKWK